MLDGPCKHRSALLVGVWLVCALWTPADPAENDVPKDQVAAVTIVQVDCLRAVAAVVPQVA